MKLLRRRSANSFSFQHVQGTANPVRLVCGTGRPVVLKRIKPASQCGLEKIKHCAVGLQAGGRTSAVVVVVTSVAWSIWMASPIIFCCASRSCFISRGSYIITSVLIQTRPKLQTTFTYCHCPKARGLASCVQILALLWIEIIHLRHPSSSAQWTLHLYRGRT
jgi:hypothetical protein